MQGPINLGKVMSAHSKFVRANGELLDKETRRAGEFALVHVGQHPEFKPRTGNLQKQTEFRIAKTKSGAVIKLSNPVKYAGAIDQGAKPHVIRPRRAGSLRFMWRGKLTFARKVNHPGNKPYRFLYRATVAAGRTFETSMRHGMGQLASKF